MFPLKRTRADVPDLPPSAPSRRAAPLTGYESDQARHRRLFNTPQIAEAPEDALRHYFREYPNVSQDCYAVVRVNGDDRRTWALTTDGLATCLAICARGKNASGETVLYLAHQTCAGSHSVDHALKVLSLDNGCDPRTVAVYILGGRAEEMDADGEPVLEADEPRLYEPLLDAIPDYPQIEGLRLPLMPFCSEENEEDEPGTAVVLTQSDVLFCRSDRLPSEGREIFDGVGIEDVTEAELDAVRGLMERRAAPAREAAAVNDSATVEPRSWLDDLR